MFFLLLSNHIEAYILTQRVGNGRESRTKFKPSNFSKDDDGDEEGGMVKDSLCARGGDKYFWCDTIFSFLTLKLAKGERNFFGFVR